MSARRVRGMDAEQRLRQARADELMLAVVARLLGEARLVRAFPTDPGEMAGFAGRIAPELEGDEHVVTAVEAAFELPRADYKVVIGEPRADVVRVSCRYDSFSEYGRLRIDGVLEEEGGSFGVGPGNPGRRVELTPLEQEVMNRAIAVKKEAGGGTRPVFRGIEFLRALVARPQPGAAVRVLAVELYGDGLVVRYTYDDPVDVRPTVPLDFYDLAGVEPPLEALLAEAEAEGGNLAPGISLRDDVGTRYIWSGGGQSGVEVAQGESQFTPAVPADASRLVVSSYAGAIELDL